MRLIVIMSLGFATVLTSGCSMCSPGFLDDYATVGSKWQRSDPTQGRVGSIFSDPGSTLAAGAAGQRVVDSHPAGVHSEVFGEAYTEDYQGAGEEFYELHDPTSESVYDSEVDDEAAYDDQVGNGTLMLGDEW